MRGLFCVEQNKIDVESIILTTPLELKAIVADAVSAALKYAPKSAAPDEYMTVAEAVKFLKISKVSLWHARREGRITALLSGRKVLFRRADLENLLTPATR